MKIRIKFFAMCREVTGTDEIVLELNESSSLDHFWNKICAAYPALEPYKDPSRVAVNMEYVRTDTVLHDGDEVCIIPPVSGG